MIEEAIQTAQEYPSKSRLWRDLPKQVMYQTFSLVLDYLRNSGKILVTADQRIVWIGGNSKLDAAIARGRKVR